MNEQRVHYLDWLTVLIVYGICAFHVALVFSISSWLVSNPQRSLELSALAGFCFPWGIAALFLIAGADAWFGLRNHSVVEFVRGRFLRLLLPLAVGILLLTPYQRFVFSHNPPPPPDRIWSFYADFYHAMRLELSPSWVSGNWLHLWFLWYLFAVSLACLPLLVWLRGAAGRRLASSIVALAGHRGGLLALGLPLVLSQLLLRPLFPGYQSWADVATYTLVFLWGALLFSERRLEFAIRREIRINLLLGAVSSLGIAALILLAPGKAPEDGRVPEVLRLLYALLWGLDVWCWLLAVLYLGIRWLDFPSRAIAYGRESVLPFYVIHHPVVLTVASVVVAWHLGLWPKFGIVLAASYGLTLALYELGVRRWGWMRVVFGLRARTPAVALPAALEVRTT